MTTTAKITCSIGTTDPSTPLGIEIVLDGNVIFEKNHVTETFKFEHNFSDNDADHEIQFVMKNKLQDHTQVDEAGNIVKDACLTINDVAFDDIQLNQILIETAVYTHDFNGTQPATTANFYGEMGCNGAVSLKFTTPIYIWLLENM